MIFEDYELVQIIKCLDEKSRNDESLIFNSLKSKLEELRKQSIHKRYTFRTTDWLVEAGKKTNKSKKVIRR